MQLEINTDPELNGPEECSFYTESHGYECVPYLNCGEDGSIITDGAGLFDIRSFPHLRSHPPVSTPLYA